MRKGENIYKRKDGRWEGRYSKGRKIDGSIKYGYIYGSTFQEVRDELYQYKIKFKTISTFNGIFTCPFEQWSYLWLREVQKEVKPATYASYQHKLYKYIVPKIGDIPLNELTHDQCQEIVSELRMDNLSASSINVIYRILKKCLNHAVKKRFLVTNPCLDVILPKEKKEKVRALTIKEQKRLEAIAVCKANSKGLPVLIALHSGLRIGEIAALKWENIDFDENTIFVERTYQRIPVATENSKTKLICESSKSFASVRFVPLTKTLRKELLKHKKDSSGIYVFSTNENPCEPRLITHHFHQIRKEANLPNIHFHQLRHTFATRCLEAKADIPSVSALLGHASTKMTLDIYADAMMEQRIQVIAMMERRKS